VFNQYLGCSPGRYRAARNGGGEDSGGAEIAMLD
jgi:hypothetical protein